MKDSYANILKKNDMKITPIRLGILKLLYDSPSPMDAEQIYNQLTKNSPANLSTIYRTLTILEEKEIFTIINIPGYSKKLYAYNLPGHRHYLVCINCNKITALNHCPLTGYDIDLERKTGFHIIGHELCLYGHCAECKEH